jgi:hypothetical protein
MTVPNSGPIQNPPKFISYNSLSCGMNVAIPIAAGEFIQITRSLLTWLRVNFHDGMAC